MIVEVEVSNRSVVQMRQDLFRYFDEPTVFSVVGISMFSQGTVFLFFLSSCIYNNIFCEGQVSAARAVAVQWSRQGA